MVVAEHGASNIKGCTLRYPARRLQAIAGGQEQQSSEEEMMAEASVISEKVLRRPHFRNDVVGGLVSAAVAVPLAMLAPPACRVTMPADRTPRDFSGSSPAAPRSGDRSCSGSPPVSNERTRLGSR